MPLDKSGITKGYIWCIYVQIQRTHMQKQPKNVKPNVINLLSAAYDLSLVR